MSRGIYPHQDYSRSFIKNSYYEVLGYKDLYMKEPIKDVLKNIKDEFIKLCDTSVVYCLRKIIEWNQEYSKDFKNWEKRKMYDIYYAFKFKNYYEYFDDFHSGLREEEIVDACLSVLKEYLNIEIIKKDLEEFEAEYQPQYYHYDRIR